MCDSCDVGTGLLSLQLSFLNKQKENEMMLTEIENRINKIEDVRDLRTIQGFVKDRKRALPEEVLIKSWGDVHQNLGAFQSLFGSSNFKIVDNSKFLKPKRAQTKFAKIMGDGLNKFVTKSVKNPIGKTWIKNQKRILLKRCWIIYLKNILSLAR